MLIKKKSSSEFNHLISSIQKAVDKNYSKLIFKCVGNYDTFLSELANVGLVKSYSLSNFVLIINLKIATSHKNAKAIISISNASKTHKLIPAATLKKNSIRQGGNLVSLVSTDKGIISNLNAVALNVGGKIFVKTL